MNMIERAEEAIRQNSRDRGYIVHERYIRHVVVAVIEAMREPTKDMIREGGQYCYFPDKCFKIMIDQALKY